MINSQKTSQALVHPTSPGSGTSSPFSLHDSANLNSITQYFPRVNHSHFQRHQNEQEYFNYSQINFDSEQIYIRHCHKQVCCPFRPYKYHILDI